MRRFPGACAVGICCCMLLITGIAGAAAAAVTRGDLMVASSDDPNKAVCRVQVGSGIYAES